MVSSAIRWSERAWVQIPLSSIYSFVLFVGPLSDLENRGGSKTVLFPFWRADDGESSAEGCRWVLFVKGSGVIMLLG